MSLRARWVLIAVTIGLMAWAALPSLFDEEQRRASPFLADEALVLGLDLQGGVHWLLRIDDGSAIDQELSSVRGSLEEEAQKTSTPLTAEVSSSHVLELRGDPDALRKLVDNYETAELADRSDGLDFSLGSRWKKDVIERATGQALEVLRRRVDGLGVREPIVAPQGAGRILVQMPGVKDPAVARKVLETTTFLEFKEVLDAAPSTELLMAKLGGALPADRVIASTFARLAKNEDPSSAKETEALLVAKDPLLTGDQLEDARVNFDRRNRALVEFQWNAEAAKRFREFTGQHIGDRLAAIIDGKVVTAPVIQSRIGRNGQITGDFTREEAANLVVQLRSGALPIPLVIEEERSVGPALGADSIRSGIQATIVGAVLVFVFMAIYYSVSGLFANVALAVNILILLGLMSLFGATLTLPGIAGVVLTIGMAVDSNVIIYERIREELRNGRVPRVAIAAGFSRSFWTIFDSNLTTLLTAFILIFLGRGPVQGFGVTLAIGLVASMFTALVVTRALMDLVYGKNPEALRI